MTKDSVVSCETPWITVASVILKRMVFLIPHILKRFICFIPHLHRFSFLKSRVTYQTYHCLHPILKCLYILYRWSAHHSTTVSVSQTQQCLRDAFRPTQDLRPFHRVHPCHPAGPERRRLPAWRSWWCLCRLLVLWFGTLAGTAGIPAWCSAAMHSVDSAGRGAIHNNNNYY